MNAKNSPCWLAFLISILVASSAYAENPGAGQEAAGMLRLFSGADRISAFQQFEKVTPPDKRQTMLFSVWAASEGKSEEVAVKASILLGD